LFFVAGQTQGSSGETDLLTRAYDLRSDFLRVEALAALRPRLPHGGHVSVRSAIPV
jgi:hypothetical protein